MRRRALIPLLLLALICLAALLLRLSVGGFPEDSPPGTLRAILELRAQRAAAGATVGAALAIAGVFLQCLLRNPLASPDLMGLAGGSGLGVTIAAYLAFLAGAHAAPGAVSAVAALAGACGALAFVYMFSQRRGLIDPVSLVLVGVVVGIMCAAATMFLQHLMPDRGMSVARWLLGAIDDDAGPTRIAACAALVLLALFLGLRAGRAMDAASLSEDEARSVGIPLGALRTLLFIASGALAAAAVLLAGPVGFVGLVCPHIVRSWIGPAHRPLILGSALAGAALILGADSLVKALDLGAGRLPIGVLTTILGGPVLIAMLRRASHSLFPSRQ